MPSLEEAFAHGAFDIIFVETTDECPLEFDIKVIPEVKQIMDRLQFVIEDAAVRQQAELRRSVMSATYASLQSELSSDKKKVEHYLTNLKEKRSSWSEFVLSYKRKRYARGLERVRALMNTSMRIVPEAPAAMSAIYSEFKELFRKDASLPTGLKQYPAG